MVMACPFTSAATSAGGECLQEARTSAAAPAARTTRRRFIGVNLYCSPEGGGWDRPACPKARFLRRVDTAGLYRGLASGGIRGQTGLPVNFRQKAPEIHGSLVSPLFASRQPNTRIIRLWS